MRNGAWVGADFDQGDATRADRTLCSERLDRDRRTTVWRSSATQSPPLYAHFGKECKLPSLDRDAHHGVCQVSSAESDVFVVRRP
jgi:hypothetical protein